MAFEQGWVEPKAFAAETQQFKDGFYALCEEQLRFLEERFGDFKPQLGAILGSGIGGLAHHGVFQEVDHLDFESIPGMTKPGTPGHEGILYWGTICNLRVMLWAGRVQTTDFLAWNTTPARAARLATVHLVVAKGLGVDTIVVTSAAGALHNVDDDEAIKKGAHIPQKGDVVTIYDYTNFSPLAGPLLAPYDLRFGQRFNGRGKLLDMRLFGYLQEALDRRCFVGSYAMSPSLPFFESRADLVRIDAIAGIIPEVPKSINVTGMSMAPELDALLSHNPTPFDAHGFDRRPRILAFSLVTNDIAPPYLSLHKQVEKIVEDANPATHEEVGDAGKDAEPYLIPAFAHVCEQVFHENQVQ